MGAVRFYGCFIHSLVGEAMPVQWTPFWFASFTAPRLAATLLFCITYTVIDSTILPQPNEIVQK